MKIFFTSDWHIGHANIIKFSNRPFKDTHEMHSAFIQRYNSVVPLNGICFFLGDMGTDLNLIKSVLSCLKGKKILILGNHDKGMLAMYNAGFDAVLYNTTLSIYGNLVTLSHCPLLDTYREDTSQMRGGENCPNWHGEHKHKKFSMVNNGQFHLHGHCHAPNSGKSKVQEGKQWDVGVDGNNYTPVSLYQVEKWIRKMLGKEA